MRKGQRFTPKYWIVHHKLTDDVYIQTASEAQEDAKTVGENLLGKTISSGGNFLDDEIGDENLAVDLFEIRFANYFSIDEEYELTEAEYMVAVKAFRDLLNSQTTDSARALIIGTANKMRLDIYAGF